MLECFFPQPKKFFASAFIWALTAILLWYFGGQDLGTVFGFVFIDKDAQPVIGLGHFATDDFLWFYIYFTVFSIIFYLFWSNYAPHRWQMWSILGSALILFFTYFQVQVAVAVNNWYRPFYDAIQNALSNESTTTANELYGYMFSFLVLAMTYVLFSVLTSFFL
jgi:peptide/bleomycin uptake transporter